MQTKKAIVKTIAFECQLYRLLAHLVDNRLRYAGKGETTIMEKVLHGNHLG